MILHNAAGVAMVLLALAAAQGRGTDIAGTMDHGGAGMAASHASATRTDQNGDAAGQDAAMGAMSSEQMDMSEHMNMSGHSAMAAHMAWSDMRPATDADRERAAEIVKTLRAA
ncbi:MAG: hypothetical protein ACXVAA_09905, partial [Candidatus Binataceae bacterium]